MRDTELLQAMPQGQTLTIDKIRAQFPRVNVIDLSNMLRRLRRDGHITSEQVDNGRGGKIVEYRRN